MKMTELFKTALGLGIAFGGWNVWARGDATSDAVAPATAPTTLPDQATDVISPPKLKGGQQQPATAPAPIPDETAALVRQLGDDNFRTRLSAADKLRRMGKPALAALDQAQTSGSLEVQVRARDLIHDIEHPTSPPERVPQASGSNGSHTVAITRDNRKMVVVARDPGRTTTVEENGEGIHMTVTGQLDGEQVTREFKAETPEALKKANPNAFALYEETTGILHPSARFGGGMLVIPQGAQNNMHIRMEMNRVEVHVGGNMVLPPPPAPKPREDDAKTPEK